MSQSSKPNGLDKMKLLLLILFPLIGSLQNDENTLFFALYGPNHDGHLFIEELISKGVSHFVVRKIPEGLELKAKFLIVEDTLDALQKFAAYYRSQFDFPIIGITGSNVKTIIK